MYERLTKRDRYGHAYTNETIYDRGMTSEDGVHYEKHYFENGTSAYDGKPIDRLCEIEDKICEGKILELPCKIGDEKFAILPLPNANVIVKGKVCTLIYQNGFLVDFGYNPDKRFGGYNAYTQLLPEELFETYEEAEAKLREMEVADKKESEDTE